MLNSTPASQSGGYGREITRPRIRVDGRLLALGGQAQRVCMDPRQVATSAPCRCSMGRAELAFWPWRMDFRRGPLALNRPDRACPSSARR